MTLVKMYAVVCDVCYRQSVPLGKDSAAAWAYAEKNGWARVPRSGGPDGRSVDYCPNHNPAGSA